MYHDLFTDQPTWEFPTVELINQVGNLPYIKDYDFTTTNFLYSRTLEWVKPPIDQELLPVWITPEDVEGLQSGFRDRGGYLELFDTIGINNLNPTDFQISRNLAEVNHLDLGSKLVLENNVYDDSKMLEDGNYQHSLYWHLDDYLLASQVIELEVIGILEVGKQFSYSDANTTAIMIGRETDLHNQIYVPNKINQELAKYRIQYRPDLYEDYETEEDLLRLNSLFVLNDSRDFKAFSEAAGEILPGFWEVRDLCAVFDKMTNSMDTLLWIADLMIWGASMATIKIISLIIVLFLRNRKHEIGIYLALGEKKTKVISQILTEVVLVAVVAISLSLFLGSTLSNLLSRQMIEQNLIYQEKNVDDWSTDRLPWELILFNKGIMSTEEMMATYDTTLELSTIVIFFGVGMGTILVSTVVPIFYIVRLNPRKILM